MRLALALGLGDENAVAMPVSAAANRGDQDFSAVYEAVKGAGGSGGQA